MTDPALAFSDLISDAMAIGDYDSAAVLLEHAALVAPPDHVSTLLTEAVECEAEAMLRHFWAPFTPGFH